MYKKILKKKLKLSYYDLLTITRFFLNKCLRYCGWNWMTSSLDFVLTPLGTQYMSQNNTKISWVNLWMCEAVNYGIDPGMLAINVWELLVSQKNKKINVWKLQVIKYIMPHGNFVLLFFLFFSQQTEYLAWGIALRSSCYLC